MGTLGSRSSDNAMRLMQLLAFASATSPEWLPHARTEPATFAC